MNRLLTIVMVMLLSVGALLFAGGDGEDGVQTVRYTFWDRNVEPAASAMKDAFEAQNPDIEIIIEVTDGQQYWQKLEAGIAADDVADVFWINYPRTPQFHAAGVLYEWEGDYPPELADIITYYTQGMTDAYLRNGKYVVFPMGYDSQGFAINTTKFAQSGISIPDATYNYEQILEVAEALQPTLPEGEFAMGMEWYGQAGYYYHVYNLGGFMLSSDGTRHGFRLPETVAGVELFKELLAQPYTPGYDAVQETPVSVRFANGQVAMAFLPSWELGVLSDEILSNTVFLPLPPLNGSNKTVVHATGNAIYAKSKNLEAAKAWVAFMNSEEGWNIQAEKGIFFPFREDDLETYTRGFGTDVSGFYGQGIVGRNFPFPFTLESGRFYQITDETIGLAVEEGADVAAVLAEAADQIEQFLPAQ